MKTRRGLASIPFVALALLGACESYDPGDRIDPTLGEPTGDAGLVGDFRPVALVLVDRCGQIDCHGSKYRNFRLYGYGSERLSATDRPDRPTFMTDDEVVADHDAVAAIEPTLFLAVIREGGRASDRLTFVRKGRGQERHKGGAPILSGDDADVCVQSWLQGRVNADACRLAVPRLAAP